MNKTAFFLTVGLFITLHMTQAQPKPGKEKIVVALPEGYRWKSARIPKDTKAIRGTEYRVAGKNAQDAPVQTVTVTTIDRRYYPMKAAGMPEEKWEYEKAACIDAELEIVDRKEQDGRTAILYSIKSAKSGESECGSTTLLTYVAEGPTAFHTVELAIPQDQLTPVLYKQWCDALLASRIE